MGRIRPLSDDDEDSLSDDDDDVPTLAESIGKKRPRDDIEDEPTLAGSGKRPRVEVGSGPTLAVTGSKKTGGKKRPLELDSDEGDATVKVKRARYESKKDLTLNEKQGEQGGFWDAQKDGGDFRFKSNLTLAGYKSGYHESAVTTDTFKFLQDAKDNQDGTHSLPIAAPKNSFFQDHTNKKVFSQTLDYVLKHADGFRTDTAQTILSAPEGKAAGHSGSGISLGGQSAAHDLLRAEIMEVLKLDPKNTKGLTEASVGALLGSMSVTSIAPAELARTVEGGTASLKAGKSAKENYEVSRNEAKRRVNELYSKLTVDEQTFVRARADAFLTSTKTSSTHEEEEEEGRGRTLSRTLAPNRSTTPERKEESIKAGEVAGGEYVSGEPTLSAKIKPPSSLTQWGLHVTEPFRAPRRLGKAASDSESEFDEII